MGKVIALILFALGAQVNAKVNAQEQLADILRERASNQIGHLPADLDQVTFGKGAGPSGGGGARPTGRREFGGTNQLMAGEGKACREENQPPSYWGGRGRKASGLQKPKINYFNTVDPRAGKREFGGTNKRMAGEGLPCQADSPAVPAYWGGEKGTKGWAIRGKQKGQAEPSQVATPFKAPAPQAPRLGGARPFVGARPFLMADLITGTGFGNIAFCVAAISLLSFALLLSRRSFVVSS